MLKQTRLYGALARVWLLSSFLGHLEKRCKLHHGWVFHALTNHIQVHSICISCVILPMFIFYT